MIIPYLSGLCSNTLTENVYSALIYFSSLDLLNYLLLQGYENRGYDIESNPDCDSDSQGNTSFLHSVDRKWNPDASSETYARIQEKLEDTNYKVMSIWG